LRKRTLPTAAVLPAKPAGLSSTDRGCRWPAGLRGTLSHIAASVPDGRSRLERYQAWRQTNAGRLAEYAAEVAVVAGLYYGAGRAGLHLAYLHGSVTALWPPVGVGIAALVILGPGVWPGIVIGDLLLADFSTPWGTIVGQTVGNTLEVVLASVLFLRLAQRRIGLERVRDVLALVACAAVGTLVSAVFGVVSLRLGDVIKASEFGSVFRTWWLGDFSGALVFTPLILTWAARRTPWRMPRVQLVEAALLFAVLLVLIEVPSQQDVPYIVFPVLIWAALRFGPVGAATALAITSSLTVWNTAHGSGPFIRTSITHSVLASQLFVAVAALTSLVLAAVTAERTASERAQQALTDEQAALRRIATLVAAEAASERVFDQVAIETARTMGARGASLARFDEDGEVTFVAGWSESSELAFPVGTRLVLDGTGVLSAVRDTGEPQRIDRYEGQPGQVVERMTRFGYGSSVAAPVKLGGHVWGALLAAADRGVTLPSGAERRLTDFADLVAQALANADAYTKLAASRVRIVEAAGTERRRLERNLHDGAQQRLVSLAVQLRMIKTSLRRDPEAAEALLAEADNELVQALEELRELARGIHPAVLTERGLASALRALVERATIPIEVTCVPEGRLPESVEAAIYYVVAEAVTNVTKYARATRATVDVERSNGIARVVVSDDGVGGAEPVLGSGLSGLADRVEALGGRLQIESPPGRGTKLTGEIPCD
jgi:signal transduction histidine kinase